MIVEKDNKIYLSVKVIPNAQANKIIGWQGKDLKIKIQAPAQKGKANQELVKYLKYFFHLNTTQIEIIRGNTSTRKLIALTGITQDKLLQTLL